MKSGRPKEGIPFSACQIFTTNSAANLIGLARAVYTAA